MSQIEIMGAVDNQHRLSLLVPEQVKIGPVKVILEIADEGEDDWRQGVAQNGLAIGATRARIYTAWKTANPFRLPRRKIEILRHDLNL